MGEFAQFGHERIKIGTCENMYYLRFSQRSMVSALPGNVNVNSEDALQIRFRFPWPDEDDVQPGAFKDYDRSVVVPDMKAPAGVEHHTIQFSAAQQQGYLVSLPCPEGPDIEPTGLRVHRNGFAGPVRLVQQKLLADGRLVPVCKCSGCGSLWRLEEDAEIRALTDAFIEEGDRRHKDSWHDGPNGEKLYCGRDWWHKIAARILEGARLK